MASSPIALLTDFGLDDPYVGQMKSVLAALAPESICIDLCHHIRPFAVFQAAFFLAASLDYLPENTVVCAVVDPGVGSGRKIVAMQARSRLVLAPDNGLLTLIPGRDALAWDMSTTLTRPGPSATFHGRDIFAPLAAKLAKGVAPGELGQPCPLESLVRLEGLKAMLLEKRILTRALHVDRFGNVLLTASVKDFGAMVREWGGARVLVPYGRPTARHVTTFAELNEGELGILPGSQGCLELALNQGSVAELLGLAPGMEIRLEQATD